MTHLDPTAGILIVTHRTPRIVAEVMRVFFLYWCQVDANHCLQITFEQKPINFINEVVNEAATEGD